MKRGTLPLSIDSLKQTLRILCSAKLHVELTDHQVATWFQVLRIFQTKTVQAAVLRVSLSSDGFPHVGKLYQACRLIEFERAEDKPIGFDELNALAESLGWSNRVE